MLHKLHVDVQNQTLYFIVALSVNNTDNLLVTLMNFEGHEIYMAQI